MQWLDKRKSYQRIPLLAMMIVIASGLHYLESLLPGVLFFPGAKLGLANIVTVLALYLFSFPDMITIVVIRVIIGSLLAGQLLGVGFYIAFSAAMVSCIVMYLVYKGMKKYPFSLIGISMIGAIFHNIVQLLVAYFFIESAAIFYYLPFLLLLSLPTGILVGFLAKVILARLKKISSSKVV